MLWGRWRFYVALVPAAPRLQGLFSVTGCGGLPFQFLLFSYIFIVCSLYVYFVYLYYPCPSLNGPVGLCFWTRDKTSDWLPTGLPPRIPGHCRLVLAGSHDSLFLWYPAIDIVWLGPVFLTLGSLSHLALCDSARWSLSHGRCGLQSLSRTPSLPLLTLTHDLTLQYSTCGLGYGINPQW